MQGPPSRYRRQGGAAKAALSFKKGEIKMLYAVLTGLYILTGLLFVAAFAIIATIIKEKSDYEFKTRNLGSKKTRD